MIVFKCFEMCLNGQQLRPKKRWRENEEKRGWNVVMKSEYIDRERERERETNETESERKRYIEREREREGRKTDRKETPFGKLEE